MRLISVLRWYSSLALCTSPSSSFEVPRSRHCKASVSAGSEAEDRGESDVAQPGYIVKLVSSMNLKTEKRTFRQVGVNWLACKYHLGFRSNAMQSNAPWGPQKGGNYSARAECVQHEMDTRDLMCGA